MQLADLVQALRLDLGDSSGNLFSDISLIRCLEKAIPVLNRDLNLRIRFLGETFETEPSGEEAELLILLGQIHACQLMRAGTANSFAFSSGDKSVDKSRLPEHWAKLQADLTLKYSERLALIRPSSSPSRFDDVFHTPEILQPVIFEQGSNG